MVRGFERRGFEESSDCTELSTLIGALGGTAVGRDHLRELIHNYLAQGDTVPQLVKIFVLNGLSSSATMWKYAVFERLNKFDERQGVTLQEF